MQTPDLDREIGHGHCGSVWTNPHEDNGRLVIKREDGGPGRSIAKDAEMHQRIQASLSSAAPIPFLNLPVYHRLVSARDSEFWGARLARFPHDATHRYEACAALVSERIQPFGRVERERVVDLFCAEAGREGVKGSKSDEDCLVRPYLGRRTHSTQRGRAPPRFFTLRNRPLNLDQLEELELPIQAYAEVMAEALAVIWWGARVDGNDVEFVLAPAGSHSEARTWGSVVLGEHTMWILDFDCCNSMSRDQAGIEQAAAAFHGNDAYYPRPGSDREADEALWRVFRERFLQRSWGILGRGSELPGMMVEALERMGGDRRAAMRDCSGREP